LFAGVLALAAVGLFLLDGTGALHVDEAVTAAGLLLAVAVATLVRSVLRLTRGPRA
jgi:hypothetical protein